MYNTVLLSFILFSKGPEMKFILCTFSVFTTTIVLIILVKRVPV